MKRGERIRGVACSSTLQVWIVQMIADEVWLTFGRVFNSVCRYTLNITLFKFFESCLLPPFPFLNFKKTTCEEYVHPPQFSAKICIYEPSFWLTDCFYCWKVSHFLAICIYNTAFVIDSCIQFALKSLWMQ